MNVCGVKKLMAGVFTATLVVATTGLWMPVTAGASPWDSKVSRREDPDRDGLATSQERSLGTNPYKADTDGGGISDGDDADPNHDGSDEDGNHSPGHHHDAD